MTLQDHYRRLWALWHARVHQLRAAGWAGPQSVYHDVLAMAIRQTIVEVEMKMIEAGVLPPVYVSSTEYVGRVDDPVSELALIRADLGLPGRWRAGP